MMFFLSSLGAGIALSFSLNSAIGVQNIILMRQGLKRAHVGALVLFCSAVDAVLMTLGVCGMGAFLATMPTFKLVLSDAGAAFLALYGLLSLYKMFGKHEVDLTAQPTESLRRVLLMMAGVTLLNPHVYIDTMLLVGTTGAAQPRALQPVFAAGAVTGSVLWFSALGYGVRWLRPWLMRPLVWRALDGITGVMMLVLAASLVMRGA